METSPNRIYALAAAIAVAVLIVALAIAESLGADRPWPAVAIDAPIAGGPALARLTRPGRPPRFAALARGAGIGVDVPAERVEGATCRTA